MGPSREAEGAEPSVASPPQVAGVAAGAGGGGGGLTARVLALQQTAGNQAVARAIAQGRLQRDDKPAPVVTAVNINHAKVSSPPESGLSLKATSVPAGAADTWTVAAGTAAVTGTSIAADGAITVGSAQPGGTVKVTGAGGGGTAWSDVQIVEKPTTLASTSGSDASSAGEYAGRFFHSFTGSSGKGAGVDGANVNEKFDSLSASTPFGPFTLKANAAGSHGWDLDASGQMVGAKGDVVSIEKSMIDAGPFIASASNAAPKALPQTFSMTQHLHTKSFPSAALDSAEFTNTPHVRTLEEINGTLVVTLKAGKDSVSVDYAGVPVFRKAAASSATVEASAPKPVAKKGAKAETWERREVQVTVEAFPTTAVPRFSLQGDALGCEVGATTGLVKIGSTPGTITVRAGSAKNFDEVKITITAPPPPKAEKTDAEGDEAEPLLAPPPDDL